MTVKTPETIPTEITYLNSIGFETIEDYYYDTLRHSVVMKKEDTAVIVDYDLCLRNGKNDDAVFDYSKYCEMQNGFMAFSRRLFRFYATEEEPIKESGEEPEEAGKEPEEKPTEDTIKNPASQNLCATIQTWLTMEPGDIEVSDNGGVFDKIHVDNTPLEKTFEDLFIETYGNDALGFLQKEYSHSLRHGRNAFVDYVVETSTGSYAIDENGVRYHHPQLIGVDAYKRQLEKQNTLSLMGFKTFRFSTENFRFRDQAIDSIRTFLGPKNAFRNAHFIKGTRPFALYTHQETFCRRCARRASAGSTRLWSWSPLGPGNR